MRVVEVQQYGGVEVLQVVRRAEPRSAEGTARVAVRAATVNPVDAFTRSGGFQQVVPGITPPLVLGWDFTGTLLEPLGDLPAGQEVAGMLPWPEAGGAGAYAEQLSARRDWVAPVPAGLPPTLAATVPLNALTADQALTALDLRPGATLLVTGASGAVGGFAVQLAAAAGLHVLAVASTGDEEHVASLGAKEVLARGDGSAVADAVRDLLPGGVDAVLDAAALGQPLLSAVREAGTFLALVTPLAPAPERGVRVATMMVRPDATRLRELLLAVAGGGLTSRVAEALPLERVAEAHERTERGGLRGKLVLTLA
ncbi:NADPH:quinone reductase-like Zn-dependent oxidoreductase [Kineococcus xinjiangensis]|uniref:NADPH:quinone reductase-like Zn-dependent oxidoreductase n=1 Tax=Kineococcus xinjiangensis TaxID=512762 RepID=A0A2S6ISZ0_9ACTN|nr:NADP-dependent oxidoreductase [Kineococcus xinjiangensis]PPK97367.1 NADPH:quinone reductase-like Zn-dependent oxidoreductase [Kineococcus xinjiangensis]